MQCSFTEMAINIMAVLPLMLFWCLCLLSYFFHSHILIVYVGNYYVQMLCIVALMSA